MKITKTSYERLDLSLSVPYTIAYETVDRTTNFILKLETNTKMVGYGCAAPDATVTSETAEEVERAIKDILVPFLKGKDPFAYALLLTELKSLLGTKSSALAMVDMALHDLISKKAGVPLYRFLGGYRNHIPTSITIGILPLEATLVQAREFMEQGFSIIKVKGGADVEEDIAKMRRLRELYPKAVFRFDGNQGYSVAESLRFFEGTRSVGIEIFEQPTRVDQDESLGRVTQGTNIPVMADESLKTLKDAFRLAQNERIDMINIKLMKVGGILEATHINSVAKSAGLEAMVGCLDECALGIAAGLHFALSRPNIHYADLDGHLEIMGDPFKELFNIKNGVLHPTAHPGLGKIDL
ncbi:mandelate racemase/muconate lactonizing enzyme family protein [Maribacter sp. 2307ULW6-5]|uniref:mandelate racemase/muconate lactonizing enzyme family protein n=1 Tax=Maribacter sp. 2307ULW6-5 TaxID=3386275 RepID=UPI0039BD2C64